MSIEQRVYESKNSYYASLYESQREWQEGQHTIWPWTDYLVRILADSYDDFETRLAVAAKSSGSKQDRVRDYVLQQAPESFRKRDVERALAGISSATIRLVLNELRDAGKIVLAGAGPGARWKRP